MLEVKNLHAWRGPAHILHGVSLSVRSREVVCLVGRNGAGKPTMCAMARGMAVAPTLLLLDEAFEGLAPVVVKRFRDAVLKIEDLGISLLIAESNLVNAARIADRLYAIDRGEIIFEGKPQQALEDEHVMKALRG